MPTQSRADAVPILLTRPQAQGLAFARQVTDRFGDRLRIILSPLMAPRFLQPTLPEGPVSALIITSQTGVQALARLGALTKTLPRHVFCVGTQTAQSLRDLGFQPVGVAPDAARLIDVIKHQKPVGRLLCLQGRDVRGNIAESLISAGIDTVSAIIYAQEAQALSREATAILQTASPVIAPLFSPRSARIFSAELARLHSVSPLFAAVISGETAIALSAPTQQIRVAVTPDAASMLDQIALLMTDIQRA